MVDKEPRQFDLGLGIEQIRGMDQPQGLLLQRQRDFRMAVAEDVHGNASQKVQVLASLDVEHTGPLSSGERQGIPGVRVHQVLLSTLHQLFGEHLESWYTKCVTVSQSARLMQSTSSENMGFRDLRRFETAGKTRAHNRLVIHHCFGEVFSRS